MTRRSVNNYIEWPSGLAIVGNTQFSTIDANDEKCAAIFNVTKTGNVSKIGFLVHTFSTNSALDVRLETVDTSTGFPTGTLFGTNTNATVNVTSLGWKEATLTSSEAVTAGGTVAVVIKQPSSGAGSLTIGTTTGPEVSFPYGCEDVGGLGYAKFAKVPRIVLGYDDGTYTCIPGIWPYATVTTTTYNNSSSPDHIGLYFKIPTNARLVGCIARVDMDGDFNLKLYNTDGATTMATKAFDKDVKGDSDNELGTFLFDTPQNIRRNGLYRLVIAPSSATNLSLTYATVSTTGVMTAMPGGADFHYTSATDPTQESDWTQINTRYPLITLLLDQVEDGSISTIKTE